MDVGMLFQHRGPETEKARPPKQVFDFRTFRSPFTSDRRHAHTLDVEKTNEWMNEWMNVPMFFWDPFTKWSSLHQYGRYLPQAWSGTNRSTCPPSDWATTWVATFLKKCSRWGVVCRFSEVTVMSRSRLSLPGPSTWVKIPTLLRMEKRAWAISCNSSNVGLLL